MKSFKSGNSVALRVPSSVGISPGEEWRLMEDGEGFRLEKIGRVKRKINVAKFWGKAKDLSLIRPEDRLFEERPLYAEKPGGDAAR